MPQIWDETTGEYFTPMVLRNGQEAPVSCASADEVHEWVRRHWPQHYERCRYSHLTLDAYYRHRRQGLIRQ